MGVEGPLLGVGGPLQGVEAPLLGVGGRHLGACNRLPRVEGHLFGGKEPPDK